MNLNQLLLILYARRKIVLGTLLTTMLTTLVLTLVLPKTYEASTALVMNFKGSDPVTGSTIPAQMMPGYMATQVDIIQSRSVATGVVERLRMQDAPAVRRKFQEEREGRGDIKDWLAGILLKNLSVVPSRESSVIGLSYQGSDPEFAAAVANAFAQEYKETAIRLRVQPLKEATAYFSEQMDTLRANLERSQSRLSKFQQDHGLVSVDVRMDVENARLNDLSSQLVVVQGQLADAVSRQREVMRGNPADIPDVVANPLVQTLGAQLSQAEARFAEIDSRLAANNPLHQSAKAEVDKIRAALAAQVRTASNSVTSGATILRNREAGIVAALQDQKAKVLELNRTRDELAVLTRDLENAQRAYDALLGRFNQTSLEGQSNQADVAVLSPALAPVSPSSPRLSLNLALALMLGLLLGAGAAIVIEMLDRRVRSHADLIADDLPFLGQVAIGASQADTQGTPVLSWTRRAITGG